MIVSHKYKFVCLNPPKTGSGFREAFLKDHSDINRFTNAPCRHWTSKEASDYIKSINRDPNDYYWFTFVRNPWERVVSYINMNCNNFLINGGSVEDISIEESLDNLSLNNLRFEDYIYRDGKLLDFIGSLENISEDLGFVFNKLKINKYISTKKDIHEHDFKEEIRNKMSQEYINSIAEKFKEVIEMKNYKFGE